MASSVSVTGITCSVAANGRRTLSFTADPSPGPGGSVTIFVDSPSLEIEDIVVNVPTAGEQVALSLLPGNGNGSVAYLGGIVRSTTGSGDLWVSEVRVAGPIVRSIVAQSINLVRATGDISATISTVESNDAAGNIALIRSDSGSITGPITAVGGIDEIVALNGTIGNLSSPVAIKAKNNIKRIEARAIHADIDTQHLGGNASDSTIWRLSATDGDITGTIKARRFEGLSTFGTPGVFATGNLDADVTLAQSVRSQVAITGTLPTNRLFSIGAANADNGVMSFGTLAGRLTINGDSARAITIANALTGTIKINGVIPAPSTNPVINRPITINTAGGLQGQIIVNASAGSCTNCWLDNVVVGGTTLSPRPEYTQLSSTLGGGAVGVVPYRLHDEDCIPANGTLASPAPLVTTRFARFRGNPTGGFNFTSASDTPITLRLYGPLEASGAPIIERQSESDPNVWIAINDPTRWEVTLAPGGKKREVLIAGKSVSYPGAYWGPRIPFGVYRVRPGTLKCAEAPANTLVDQSWVYYFRLDPDCDLNGTADTGSPTCFNPATGTCVADCDNGTGTGTPDGGVAIEDLLYYLALYETGDLSADVDNGSGSGTIDNGVGIEDLLYYLARFEFGC